MIAEQFGRTPCQIVAALVPTVHIVRSSAPAAMPARAADDPRGAALRGCRTARCRRCWPAPTHLDRPVRWVHVTETASVAHLVSGGELLLSTGVGWPSDDAGLRGFVAQLVQRRYRRSRARARRAVRRGSARAGRRGRRPRPPARSCCTVRPGSSPSRRRCTARIISDQMAALRARDDIHALFTELSLRGSPADFIVSQVGRVLGRAGGAREPQPPGGRARGARCGRRRARRVGAALAARAPRRRTPTG